MATKKESVFDRMARINRRRVNLRAQIERFARLNMGDLTNEYNDELAAMWKEYDFLHSIELNKTENQ
ncbi:MAG: hypothetical protein NC311_15260 [Muribaculaceae bacterium]|nr:hypothetical protein [Muribaculaceae bacterium]